jgi:hypothetical protein
MIDNIPILHISTLVSIPRPFILSANPLFQDEPIIYKIIENDFPNFGSISKIANDKYLYQSDISGVASIKYIAVQNTNTSSPPIEVEIDRQVIIFRTYTQYMVNLIPRTLGTYRFDNISFDGNIWKFGTISSNFFHSYTDQGPDIFFMQDSLNSIFQLGNLRLINNAPSNPVTPINPVPFPNDPLGIIGLNINNVEVQQILINWRNQSPFRSWRFIILPGGNATSDFDNFRLDIFVDTEGIIIDYIMPINYQLFTSL